MRALILSGLLLFVGCSSTADDGTPLYDNSDLELITSFTAKEMCSCLFVMEKDEAYCRVWTKQAPAVASAHIDFEAKTVASGAVGFWDARARFVDDRRGCVLER